MVDLGPVVTLIVQGSVVLLLCLLALVCFGPSQYDPYISDQVNEVEVADPTDEVSYGQDESKKTQKKVDGEDITKRKKFNSSVTIIVLGDIGRSPRMQYHAISFAEEGAFVNLVGYQESDIHPSLRNTANVKVHALTPPPKSLTTSNTLLFPLLGPLKVLWQSTILFRTLYFSTRPTRWHLIQTPPAIPSLLIARLVTYTRNSTLVIDWHNFTSSILALKLGNGHPLVGLTNGYETLMAKMADRHITVSRAMAFYMHRTMNVTALPFHDRPTSDFQPLPSSQRGDVLARIAPTAPHAEAIMKGQTRLLVTSTSWTPDEDFDLLLSALVSYSATSKATSNATPTPTPTLPPLLIIITGKGPLRSQYVHKIADLEDANELLNVTIRVGWLSFPDYASLLGAADLGISLHTSASGLDLPMKVVDMFGAGLPVVGWSKYKSWGELVTEGVNGRGFGGAEELGGLLVELCSDGEGLGKLKEGALRESGRRWREEWLGVCGDGLFYPERRVSMGRAKGT